MGHLKLDWRFYWNQLRKRFWLVIFMVLISLALGAYQVSKKRPLYQASTQLLVQEPMGTKLNPFRDPLAVEGGLYLRTQLRLIKSRSLAFDVVDALSLDQHPVFLPRESQSDSMVQILKQWGQLALQWGQKQASNLIARLLPAPPELPSEAVVAAASSPKQEMAAGQRASGLKPAGLDAIRPKGSAIGPEGVSEVEGELASMDQRDVERAQAAAKSRVAHLILSGLQVTPVPLSSMLNVSFQAHDPQLAADVVNTLSRLYAEQAKQSRFETVKEAMDWLQSRVDQMRDKVEHSQLKLQQYKKEHGIYSLDDRLPGVMQEMAALNTALTQARTERIEYETLYEEMQRASRQDASLDWMPAVVGNEFIQELKQQLAGLQRELKQLEKSMVWVIPRWCNSGRMSRLRKSRLKPRCAKSSNPPVPSSRCSKRVKRRWRSNSTGSNKKPMI